MKNERGFGKTIVAVAVLAIIIYIAFLAIPKSQPIIGTETSIDPQRFKTSLQSTLKLSLTNSDHQNLHDVCLRFVTNNLVHLYLGPNELVHETPNSGNYTYSLTFQPAQKIEQPFTVRVKELPIGIASQEFSITVQVYTDNKLETTQKVKFTVEEV